MQDTIKTSFKMGSQRVFGTLIGGLVGFLLFLVIPENPISMWNRYYDSYKTVVKCLNYRH